MDGRAPTPTATLPVPVRLRLPTYLPKKRLSFPGISKNGTPTSHSPPSLWLSNTTPVNVIVVAEKFPLLSRSTSVSGISQLVADSTIE